VSTEQDQNGKGDAILPHSTNGIVVRWHTVSSIKTPPFSGVYADVVRETLRRHGCSIQEHQEYVLVTFPAGTRKRASHLQTLQERYRIILPDGYELYEICSINRELSVLALFADE
jgi:hypothetical protein